MTKAKDKRNAAAYQTVNYSEFEKTADKLSMIPAVLSKAIGYSNHTHLGWKRNELMPKSAALACECLLRRKNKEDTRTPIDLYFLTVPRQHTLALESFCKALKINTQRFTAKSPPAG